MKTGAPPATGPSGHAAPPEWRRQIEAWRELLDECMRKPTRGRVHALRVATLRLQSDVPYWLQGQEAGDLAARALRRWNRQAEKLRRALRPVRAADVDLGKLAGLRNLIAEPDRRQPRASGRCLRQIEKLARRFRQTRRAAEKELVAEMQDRRQRLRRTSQAMERALGPLRLRAERATPEKIREMLVALAEKFPELNEGNLHKYRMRIKAVRYLADLAAPQEARAARQAAAMGRMQVAAGEWHDLKMLAKKAARELGDHDRRGGLVELLDDLTAESLQKALALCRRTTAQLLKQNARGRASLHLVPKKPPQVQAAPRTATGRRLA